jgi:hypothetical protein
MRGSEETSRAGRVAAIATLAASAALFLTALLGIASIDPDAGAAAPGTTPVPAQQAPPARSVSLEHADAPASATRDRDCPRRDKRASGVSS